MAEDSREGSSTPSQFTAQSATAEDLLKSQTVGLVKLADFRKRRAEVLEQKEREAQENSPFASGSSTPRTGVSSSQPVKKKQKKAVARGKLSFGVDDDDEEDKEATSNSPASGEDASRSNTPSALTRDGTPTEDIPAAVQRRLGPNNGIANAPRAMTKSSMLKDAQMREQLRKEFLTMQEAVKATEIAIPFVFYDGTNIPGGVCRVKKGDHVWLFLDRSRKVGASLGVGKGDRSKKEWARIGVDDLMLVRGEIIIPHHYDFHYFILNKTRGFNGLLFDYSDKAPASTKLPGTSSDKNASYDPLSRPSAKDKDADSNKQNLEGAKDDPNITKVVDRRWYERNKHIFPASVWEEFDPAKDYSKGIRKDTMGNSYFFT